MFATLERSLSTGCMASIELLDSYHMIIAIFGPLAILLRAGSIVVAKLFQDVNKRLDEAWLSKHGQLFPSAARRILALNRLR